MPTNTRSIIAFVLSGLSRNIENDSFASHFVVAIHLAIPRIIGQMIHSLFSRLIRDESYSPKHDVLVRKRGTRIAKPRNGMGTLSSWK